MTIAPTTPPATPPAIPAGEQRSAVRVEPATGFTGAYISGVDLRDPLDAATVADIRTALLRWKVVFFRDQPLDNAQHVRFARYFGVPTDTTVIEPRRTVDIAEFPEIFPFDQDHSAPDTDLLPQDQKWHADGTAYVNPPLGAIVRTEATLPHGGDTSFVNLVAAYEGLPRALREFVDGLRAVHRLSWSFFAPQPPALRDAIAAAPRETIHPVVRVHPETGERGLFVNPVFTDFVVGFTYRQSRYVLDLLFEEIEKPEYAVNLRWEPGTIAFWDNRAALHRAPADLRHQRIGRGDRRILHVSLLGDTPVGPDGRSSTAVLGGPGTAFDPPERAPA
jgi:taurine dioxygenase